MLMFDNLRRLVYVCHNVASSYIICVCFSFRNRRLPLNAKLYHNICIQVEINCDAKIFQSGCKKYLSVKYRTVLPWMLHSFRWSRQQLQYEMVGYGNWLWVSQSTNLSRIENKLITNGKTENNRISAQLVLNMLQDMETGFILKKPITN